VGITIGKEGGGLMFSKKEQLRAIRERPKKRGHDEGKTREENSPEDYRGRACYGIRGKGGIFKSLRALIFS